MENITNLLSFVGKHVKIVFIDDERHKVARGILANINDGFLIITSEYGDIAIAEKTVCRINTSKEDV